MIYLHLLENVPPHCQKNNLEESTPYLDPLSISKSEEQQKIPFGQYIPKPELLPKTNE